MTNDIFWSIHRNMLTLPIRPAPGGIDLGIVETEADRDGPRLSGNADALRILIVNLLDHALRYTTPGGRVDVTVTQTIVRSVANAHRRP